MKTIIIEIEKDEDAKELIWALAQHKDITWNNATKIADMKVNTQELKVTIKQSRSNLPNKLHL